MTVHFSAPGKLFVSGEWSILEMGTRGMVAAVNSRVHVFLEPSSNIIISAEDFGIHDISAEYKDGRIELQADDKTKATLKLLSEAITTALRYLEAKNIRVKHFELKTSSKDLQIIIDGQPRKVGFGSSAAVVVAIIAALLDFHNYTTTKEELYKLATIAHYFAQGKVGSAFDVAASAYGGLFVYSRFDPDWLTKKMEAGEDLAEIIAEKWPGFYVKELEIPQDFCLLIGWTKQEASTSPLVKQMNEYKKNNLEKYTELINVVADCASHAIDAWNKNDRKAFLEYLEKNRIALEHLGKESGVNIETPDLGKLAVIAKHAGAAGKLSGAGGGDCGIAVCFDAGTEEKIKSEWKNAGILPIETTIDREGARKE